MRAIFESLFDIIYLVTVITLGIIMIKKSEKKSITWFMGLMALVLGIGDAFHLIPRAYGLLFIGLEANAVALGAGKMLTSITMTVFYVILYYVLRKRYNTKGKSLLSASILILAAVRIVISLLPQNDWFVYNAPQSWSIYRNIPFLIMGIIIICFAYKYAKLNNDKIFKNLWLAITLSFAFYVPVILFANSIPAIGMLMIPKTVCYVWIVIMGYNTLKENTLQEKQ